MHHSDCKRAGPGTLVGCVRIAWMLCAVLGALGCSPASSKPCGAGASSPTPRSESPSVDVSQSPVAVSNSDSPTVPATARVVPQRPAANDPRTDPSNAPQGVEKYPGDSSCYPSERWKPGGYWEVPTHVTEDGDKVYVHPSTLITPIPNFDFGAGWWFASKVAEYQRAGYEVVSRLPTKAFESSGILYAVEMDLVKEGEPRSLVTYVVTSRQGFDSTVYIGIVRERSAEREAEVRQLLQCFLH